MIEYVNAEMGFEYFEVVDRLTKLTAMLLGMSINFEKEILNMFIIFQQSFKLDELSLAREDYRRLETKQY